MPVAVISDIQGKIAALDAVLANLSARTIRGSRNGAGWALPFRKAFIRSDEA